MKIKIWDALNVTSESGKLLEFTVTAEQAVVFRAGPRDKR